jgi:Tfp pilus assembly pilus retraction ATPase PilT/serine/threonine protein kinase
MVTLCERSLPHEPGESAVSWGGLGCVSDTEIIAGYEVLGTLGRGDTGRILKARQRSLDRLVVLKVLEPRLAADEAFVERFLREARAAATLRDPHIVELIDQGTCPETGAIYIAFEFIDGCSLEELLQREGAMEERRALQICLGVAEALSCAEENGFVHRDVNPDNILVGEDGVPRLMDLGLARRKGDLGSGVGRMASPHYVSPEQALGRKDVDIRADLYALGVVLYRCLTNECPFADAGDEFFMVVTRIVNEDVPSPRKLRSEVSTRTARVLEHLCCRERDQRYPSARAACVDLFRALEGDPPLGPAEAQRVGSSVDLTKQHRLESATSGTTPVPFGPMSMTDSSLSLGPFAIRVFVEDEMLEEHVFQLDQVRVGRSPDCELTIDDHLVSRLHLEIRRRHETFGLLAHPSTNGTTVDGRQVEDRMVFVTDRSRVLVANKYRLELDSHPRPRPRAVSPESGVVSPSSLVPPPPESVAEPAVESAGEPALESEASTPGTRRRPKRREGTGRLGTRKVPRRQGESAPVSVPRPSAVLEELLDAAMARSASDLHLAAGQVPSVRVAGAVEALDAAALDAEGVEALLAELSSQGQRDRLDTDGGLVLTARVSGSRLRVLAMPGAGGLSLSVRLLPERSWTLAELHLPDEAAWLTSYRHGLVLVAGPRRGGVTTSLMALAQALDAARAVHVVTVEDHMECSLRFDHGVVTQRVLGPHLGRPLRAEDILRCDPDAVVVGQVHDAEVARLTLELAESGVLVLAGVTAGEAARAAERLAAWLEPEERDVAHERTLDALRGVLWQRLVPTGADPAVVPEVELAFNTLPVAQALRARDRDAFQAALNEGRDQGQWSRAAWLAQLEAEGLAPCAP